MNEHDNAIAPSQDAQSDPAGEDEAQGFFDKPSTRRAVWIILIGLCVVFALAGFVVDLHGYFPVESFGVFYAIFGFVSFSFIVLAGQHLRKILMRPEDYYDR
ncbi:MAG: hypothetical protein AAFW68_01325 [Pseudomonadota bacterium]